MHLLAAVAAPKGLIGDGDVAVDLGQSPGDIVVLSSADSDLACLAAARARLGDDFPRLRLANLLALGHPYSVDLYIDSVLASAKIVLVRVLGGAGYWRYGIDRLHGLARERGLQVALIPGDARPDHELTTLSTLKADELDRLWRLFLEGGVDNAEAGLKALAGRLDGHPVTVEPQALPAVGVLGEAPAIDPAKPLVPLLFYRAQLQAGDIAPVTALAEALLLRGCAPLPIYLPSLKAAEAKSFLAETFAQRAPDVIVNLTAFASNDAHPPGGADCVVLQAVAAGSDQASWAEDGRGLGPRDIAMHVALPEIDGRVLAGAVSFKERRPRDPLTEADIAGHQPDAGRIARVADLAASWARLRRLEADERRVALVLAQYPVEAGRIGNGVGLDTPESAVGILRAMQAAGYDLGPDLPTDGADLIRRLHVADATWSLDAYRRHLAGLPPSIGAAIDERWGAVEADPHVAGDAVAIQAITLGRVTVMVQPARAYGMDLMQSHHDGTLVPPHRYLAAYGWLATRADAVIHVGKHGTLEWLPGKALALSEDCFPDAILSPLPHLYPFIVNDPGEGTQAKRRTAAVIVDHLTPPLTRAESYGPLAELERLVDEYWEAASLDPRRIKPLALDILGRADAAGVAAECGIGPDDPPEAALAKLDGFLCLVKERQIRDGLHVFGVTPAGDLMTDLLAALVRVQRSTTPDGASLVRALADDLGLGFDPLACDMAAPWAGPKPGVLTGDGAWRIAGDTVERLELLARALIAGERPAEPGWTRTKAVLDWVDADLRPRVASCGAQEMAGLLAGLDGRFVGPAPSGAPTRGRIDVLPTGRNFYAVDPRGLPTPTAWTLGWRSASMLIDRYVQDHGRYPARLAISLWGTATMRTGGDDIAQALALMGVRPVWDNGSSRLSGFEILPASLLDRPRVDVVLRVSGLFRDAFPGLIDLADRAARAVAALDEPADVNPLAAHVAGTRTALEKLGLVSEEAARLAACRVFGSADGAYGAGLDRVLTGDWNDLGDLAEAYLAAGGIAWGSDGDGGAQVVAEGPAGRARFADLLAGTQGVIQAQDNREHDLLDSDAYFQFEGGISAAIAHLSGAAPAVYHADHSRPDTPMLRRLEEELALTVRARAVNPKWIAGAMRHGYKGAAELAATVDFLFAFAATTGKVTDRQFDAIYDAYLGDADVARFLDDANPAAKRSIAARLDEAITRGLWRPRSNSAGAELEALKGRPA